MLTKNYEKNQPLDRRFGHHIY